MSNTCENCGSRMSGGFCTWCDEEHFIAQQYHELGMETPESIASKAAQQEARAEERSK